ncbi:NAD(P)-bd_dom domain-containing protein, partial [Haematococcus lacustris]
GGKQEDEDGEEGEGDAILVTDADTPMGEQVVLQLILARASIKALVRDTVAAKTSYGPYVAPLSLDTGNPQLLRRALKGCGSVVCLGRPGALPQVAKEAGVAHVVLLSAAGAAPQGGPLSGLFDGELAALRDSAREAAFAKAGVRCTVVRVAAHSHSGACAGSGQAAGPSVSREDVAAVLVQALQRLPAEQSRIFEVRSLGAGAPPSDWSALFDSVASAPA